MTLFPLDQLQQAARCASLNELADLIAAREGRKRQNVYRQMMKFPDGLPSDWADRWACVMGFHPAEIWDGWDDRLDVEDGLMVLRGLRKQTVGRRRSCRRRVKRRMFDWDLLWWEWQHYRPHVCAVDGCECDWLEARSAAELRPDDEDR